MEKFAPTKGYSLLLVSKRSPTFVQNGTLRIIPTIINKNAAIKAIKGDERY